MDCNLYRPVNCNLASIHGEIKKPRVSSVASGCRRGGFGGEFGSRIFRLPESQKLRLLLPSTHWISRLLPSGYDIASSPWKITIFKFGKPSNYFYGPSIPWRTVSHNQVGYSTQTRLMLAIWPQEDHGMMRDFWTARSYSVYGINRSFFWQKRSYW